MENTKCSSCSYYSVSLRDENYQNREIKDEYKRKTSDINKVEPVTLLGELKDFHEHNNVIKQHKISLICILYALEDRKSKSCNRFIRVIPLNSEIFIEAANQSSTYPYAVHASSNIYFQKLIKRVGISVKYLKAQQVEESINKLIGYSNKILLLIGYQYAQYINLATEESKDFHINSELRTIRSMERIGVNKFLLGDDYGDLFILRCCNHSTDKSFFSPNLLDNGLEEKKRKKKDFLKKAPRQDEKSQITLDFSYKGKEEGNIENEDVSFEEFMNGNSQILSNIELNFLGSCSISSVLVRISDAVFFLGSETSDSYLFRLHTEPKKEKEESDYIEETRNSTISYESIPIVTWNNEAYQKEELHQSRSCCNNPRMKWAEEDNHQINNLNCLSVQKLNESFHKCSSLERKKKKNYIEILSILPNLGPILDFCYRSTSVDCQDDNELVMCTGLGRSGGISIIHNRIETHVLSEMNLPQMSNFFLVKYGIRLEIDENSNKSKNTNFIESEKVYFQKIKDSKEDSFENQWKQTKFKASVMINNSSKNIPIENNNLSFLNRYYFQNEDEIRVLKYYERIYFHVFFICYTIGMRTQVIGVCNRTRRNKETNNKNSKENRIKVEKHKKEEEEEFTDEFEKTYVLFDCNLQENRKHDCFGIHNANILTSEISLCEYTNIDIIKNCHTLYCGVVKNHPFIIQVTLYEIRLLCCLSLTLLDSYPFKIINQFHLHKELMFVCADGQIQVCTVRDRTIIQLYSYRIYNYVTNMKCYKSWLALVLNSHSLIILKVDKNRLHDKGMQMNCFLKEEKNDLEFDGIFQIICKFKPECSIGSYITDIEIINICGNVYLFLGYSNGIIEYFLMISENAAYVKTKNHNSKGWNHWENDGTASTHRNNNNSNNSNSNSSSQNDENERKYRIKRKKVKMPKHIFQLHKKYLRMKHKLCKSIWGIECFKRNTIYNNETESINSCEENQLEKKEDNMIWDEECNMKDYVNSYNELNAKRLIPQDILYNYSNVYEHFNVGNGNITNLVKLHESCVAGDKKEVKIENSIFLNTDPKSNDFVGLDCYIREDASNSDCLFGKNNHGIFEFLNKEKNEEETTRRTVEENKNVKKLKTNPKKYRIMDKQKAKYYFDFFETYVLSSDESDEDYTSLIKNLETDNFKRDRKWKSKKIWAHHFPHLYRELRKTEKNGSTSNLLTNEQNLIKEATLNEREAYNFLSPLWKPNDTVNNAASIEEKLTVSCDSRTSLNSGDSCCTSACEWSSCAKSMKPMHRLNHLFAPNVGVDSSNSDSDFLDKYKILSKKLYEEEEDISCFENEIFKDYKKKNELEKKVLEKMDEFSSSSHVHLKKNQSRSNKRKREETPQIVIASSKENEIESNRQIQNDINQKIIKAGHNGKFTDLSNSGKPLPNDIFLNDKNQRSPLEQTDICSIHSLSANKIDRQEGTDTSQGMDEYIRRSFLNYKKKDGNKDNIMSCSSVSSKISSFESMERISHRGCKMNSSEDLKKREECIYLTNGKRFCSGTQGIRFKKFKWNKMMNSQLVETSYETERKKQSVLFVCGSEPIIVFSKMRKCLTYSKFPFGNIFLVDLFEDFDYLNPFHDAFTNYKVGENNMYFLFYDGNKMKVSTFKDVHSSYVEKIPFYRTVEKVASHPETGLLVVSCPDEEKNKLNYMMKHIICFFDPNKASVRYTFTVPENYDVSSICMYKVDMEFYEKTQIKTLILVGTSEVRNSETDPQSGHIFIFVARKTQNTFDINHIYKYKHMGGGIVHLKQYKEYLLAASNNKLIIFCINKVMTYYAKEMNNPNMFTHILNEARIKVIDTYEFGSWIMSLDVVKDSIFLGGMISSVVVLKFDPKKKEFDEECKDYKPIWCCSMKALSESHVLICDIRYNFYIVQKSMIAKNDEEQWLLSYSCIFEQGSIINKMNFVGLKKYIPIEDNINQTILNQSRAVVCSSADGSISAMIPFQHFNFFKTAVCIEAVMEATIHSIGADFFTNKKSEEIYKNITNAYARGIVDIELLKKYFKSPLELQLKIYLYSKMLGKRMNVHIKSHEEFENFMESICSPF